MRVRSVDDIYSAAEAAVCGMWRYTSVICLPFPIWFHAMRFNGVNSTELLYTILKLSLSSDPHVVTFQWTLEISCATIILRHWLID